MNMLATQYIRAKHFSFGHGQNFHWYELVLLPLAVLIVYPDRVLRRLFSKAASIYQLALFEFVAISLLAVGTILLMRIFDDFVWWMPLALVLFCFLLRVVLLLIDFLI